MNDADEKRIAAKPAKTLAMLCVRNTILEDLHAGITPVSKTGNYSDVGVIDAEGREIPWAEVSHLDDETSSSTLRRCSAIFVTPAFPDSRCTSHSSFLLPVNSMDGR